MASEKLTGFIVLNEIANFKGTPKKFREFEKKLRNKFPGLDSSLFSKKGISTLAKHYPSIRGI